jgi:rod shape-determining protein MreD
MSILKLFPHIFIALLLLIVQTTLIPFVGVTHIVPDLFVIWIVYLAIVKGQIAGTVAGFLAGLLLDVMSGNDGMMGLSSLAKCVCGFTAGYFYDSERVTAILSGGRFLAAIAIAGLLHHVIYFLIFLQGSSLNRGEAILYYALPSTLYTVTAGLVPMFVFRRKYLS